MKLISFKTFIKASLSILWIGLMIAGLWPFNFFPPNHASWLQGRNGLHFNRFGEIYSPGAWIAHPGNDFTIELWLASNREYHSFNPILTIDHPDSSQNFMVAQFRSNLIVEGQFENDQRSVISQRLWIDDALRDGQPLFLTVTSSSSQGTTVYIDGVLEHAYPKLKVLATDLSGQLLLGHAFSGHQSWSGDVFGLAYYERPLSAAEVAAQYQVWQQAKAHDSIAGAVGLYPFDEQGGELVHNRANGLPDLVLPKEFHVFHKAVLEFPRHPNRSDLLDGVENVIGFIPFGLLAMIYFREVRNNSSGKSFLAAVILGGLTSLVIEVLQIYLPTRDSSLLDLINNFVGSALGAFIPYRWLLTVLRTRINSAS